MLSLVMITSVSLLAAGPMLSDAPVSTPAAQATKALSSVPRLGASLEIGVPDGLAASLHYRPMRWMRLSLGGLHNGVSAGVRGGILLSPIDFPIAPTVSVELGHYFPGDANQLFESFSGENPQSPLLSSVGYQFANAHLGLEVGSQKRFLFFLRAGLSYLQLPLENAQQLVGEFGGASIQMEDPIVRLTLPSAKLGIVFFIG